ncbi:MAG: DNA polymerase III subunit gamma/tau [Alphaproteobacteria bacterium]|nr:DNA polymerase III subunit gamma/tau [Alphaproteobacteria bacterium]
MSMGLARKYRPTLFRDVVGQDLFVRILRNALAEGRLSSGLLLTGIRGVGKTTLARLVAKALSCTSRDADQEPCNGCPSCLALIQDKHVDILEMDAASHTGVDDIRQILDSCSYKPLLGHCKIYIIDEVHMLSKSAFNALLKTLEEPPAHVTFIFATTDVNKVPLTVISRCQQLHLHRVKSDILAKHLKDIAEQEGYGAEQSVYDVLAQYSEGGVRDALSLLERVLLISSPQSPITLDDALSVLGLPRTQWLEQWFDCLHHGNGASMVDLIRQQYHQGSEPITLLSHCMQWIHEKTMACLNHPAQHPSIALDRYDQWWQLGQKGLSEVSASPFPLLALEMVTLRMAYMTHFPTQSQILSFIEPFGQKANTGAVGSSVRPIAESKVSHPHALSPTHHPSQASPLGQSTGESDPEKTTKTPAVVWNQSSIASLDNLLLALAQAREGLLHAHVRSNVSWVGWDNAALVLHWDKTRGAMPKTFAASFDQFFKHHMEKGCHIRWNDTAHSLSQMAQEEQKRAHYDALAKQNSGIQTILNTFPDATIEQITKL